MIALIIVILFLVLLLILPVGVDISYLKGVFALKVKVGPLRIGILPKKEGASKKQTGTEKPQKKQKSADQKGGKGVKPGLADFLKIAGVILKTVSRFRKTLSIDVFHLVFVAAAKDPYHAVMEYGYLNAAFSALSPLLHNAVRIRDERVVLDLDVSAPKPVIEAQLLATLQIWEIFYIGFSAGFGYLLWFLPFRKAAREKERTEAKAGAHPVEQKG